jgi:hypothetical protein
MTIASCTRTSSADSLEAFVPRPHVNFERTAYALGLAFALDDMSNVIHMLASSSVWRIAIIGATIFKHGVCFCSSCRRRTIRRFCCLGRLANCPSVKPAYISVYHSLEERTYFLRVGSNLNQLLLQVITELVASTISQAR